MAPSKPEWGRDLQDWKGNSRIYCMENSDVAERDKQNPMLYELQIWS